MKREMSNLRVQYKTFEQIFGQDALLRVLAKAYLAKLLENEAI